MNAFEVYCYYLALKLHFTQKNYDCFKYNWKTNAKFSTFTTRKDRYFFEKLAKLKDPKGFILSNLLVNDSWVGDMVNNQEAESNYMDWMKRRQSLTYMFKQDLKKIDDFNEFIVVKDGQHPLLIKSLMRGDITWETAAIIVDLSGCKSYYDRKLGMDPVAGTYVNRISKYIPFVEYDKKKFRSLIVEEFAPKELA